jgi:hypothetical protein
MAPLTSESMGIDRSQPNYRLANRHLGRVRRRFHAPLLSRVWDGKATKFGLFALAAIALYVYSRNR